MITVFIWPGLLHANAGHAAMKVDSGFPPGELYISWWPAGVGGVIPFLLDQNTQKMLSTFGAEDQVEGGVNFHAIQIFGLDEDAVKAWWANWMTDITFRLFHKDYCKR